MGKVISHLYEQLGTLPTFLDRVTLLNHFFLSRLEKARPIHPVYLALQRLAAGTRTIEGAACEAGLCRRQLERKARMYAGVAPKDLARIGRFQRALRLGRENLLNWTDIAHATGYHDHMHLVRDFRVYAGDSPTGARRSIAAEHLINFSPSK